MLATACHCAPRARSARINGLDTFEFDGSTYSRLPHLKLGDHTSPNEGRRVYFAMDPDSERFVVRVATGARTPWRLTLTPCRWG